MKNEKSFKNRVNELVAQIPKGKVMTYGQIAALCGRPRAARMVGGIAHHGDTGLPWHRIVKKDGGLAEGYPGGTQGHRAALEVEGVRFTGSSRIADMHKRLWQGSL